MDSPVSPQVAFAALALDGWQSLPFEPFRDGVEVSWLRRDDPVVALLRYAPGASVPRHEHTGLETILVLEGTQWDDSGAFGTGSLILNPAGSVHTVWSETGCTVLIQWERPVRFVDPHV